MALQLTGAFKRDALPNLQVRLPAVVIGGGLTGDRHRDRADGVLPAAGREDARALRDARRASSARRACAAMYDAEELELLDEFLRARPRGPRRARARRRGAASAPDFVPLVRGVGRRHARLPQAHGRLAGLPAEPRRGDQGARGRHRLRREPESDRGRPRRARRASRRWSSSGKGGWRRPDGRDRDAAGAHGARRRRHDAEHHLREGSAGHVPARREEEVLPAASRRRERRRPLPSRRRMPNGFFTSYDADGRFVTYYGDNHPRYAGNVVKAMASAKHGYPHVVRLFARRARARSIRRSSRSATRAWRRWSRGSTTSCSRTSSDVVRLTPTIVEVIVKAPAAARHFQPGQFYRLQNFESLAPRVRADGTSPLLMEGIALTGAWVDKEKGLLSLIALELGVSSRLVRVSAARASRSSSWGRPARRPRFPNGQNVLLLGGGLGNAVLFSIAKAMRDARQPRDLLRRLQEGRGSVQARGDRGGDRSGDLEHRHRRGDRAAAAAGRALPRQHRAGDARLSATASSASRSCRSTTRRSHHRHRLGSHDGGGEGRAARRAGAVPEAGSRRHRAASTRRCSA